MTSPRMRSDITQIAGLPRLELHVLWTMYQGERLSIKCYVMLLKTLFALVFSLERGLDGFQIVDATFRRSSSALIGTQNPSIVACLVKFKRRSVLSLGSTDGDGWCAQGGRGTTVGPSAQSIRMEIWASQKIRLADLGENRRVEICSSPLPCSCGPHTLTWISIMDEKKTMAPGIHAVDGHLLAEVM